jgi:Domain of unknown function (DUF4124)
MRRFPPVIACIALWLLPAAAAGAATVYRWVDEQGKVHYSELVPERYQKAAKPVDTTAGQPGAEQQREALERAQKERARAPAAAAAASAAAAAKQARPPSGAASAASPASRAAAKRPAQTPDDQTDCETWQRLFLESAACFGPYRTVRGATKPEAFDVCNVVLEPPPRCRIGTP